MTFERRLDRTGLILLAVCSIALLFLHSARAALSLAVGGALSVVNFHWLKQAVDFIVERGGTGRIGRRIALQYAARYGLIGLVLYVTIRFSVLDPVLVLGGLFTYILAAILESIFEIARSWKNMNY